MRKKAKESRLDVAMILCPPFEPNLPPMGIAYIIEYLLQNGIKADFFDLSVDLYHEVQEDHKKLWELTRIVDWSEKGKHKFFFDRYGKYIAAYLKDIVSKKSRSICFSVNPANQFFTEEAIRIVRGMAPKISIIVGGTYVSAMENNPDVDHIILGEGEITLYNLIMDLKKGAVTKKVLQSDVPDIRTLPFPRYERFDLDKYRTKTILLAFSRGCFGRCNFCMNWVNNPYRCRSGEDVFNEVSFLKKKYGISDFTFSDLLLNGNLRELERFCDLVIKADLKIQWGASAIINPSLIPIMDKIKKAGCSVMEFGVESFSPRVVKLMNKPYKPKFVTKVLKSAVDSGIIINTNLIIGYPGETEEDFEEGLRIMKENAEYISFIGSFNLPYLYGLSELNLHPERHGITIPEDNGGFRWYTDDNDFNTRIDRFCRIIDALNEKEIAFKQPHNSNLLDHYVKRTKKKVIFINTSQEGWHPDQQEIKSFDFYQYLLRKSRYYLSSARLEDIWEDPKKINYAISHDLHHFIEFGSDLVRNMNPGLVILDIGGNEFAASHLIRDFRKTSNTDIVLVGDKLDNDVIKRHKQTNMAYNGIYYIDMSDLDRLVKDHHSGKRLNELLYVWNFSRMTDDMKSRIPAYKLLYDCYREHGLMVTLKKTMKEIGHII